MLKNVMVMVRAFNFDFFVNYFSIIFIRTTTTHLIVFMSTLTLAQQLMPFFSACKKDLLIIRIFMHDNTLARAMRNHYTGIRTWEYYIHGFCKFD